MTNRQDSLTDEQDAWLAANQNSFPDAVRIERIWTKGHREEHVNQRFGGSWRISDLQALIKDEPVFDLPLEWIDIASYSFDVEKGLFDFARHMKHVQEASLEFPIIMDEWGAILDGRHRIVKALLEGAVTIKCVRIPYGAHTTSN